MSDFYLGQIVAMGFNFAPKGWAQCNGQLLPIAQNQALFSLLGTVYGGNGTTNFALPDLRSRAPVHYNAGGSTGYPLGAIGGVENVTLLPNQLPIHTHSVSGTNDPGSTRVPDAALFGKDNTAIYATVGGPQVPLSASTIAPAGNTQPHPNVQPYLAVNYCIAIVGVYPSRN